MPRQRVAAAPKYLGRLSRKIIRSKWPAARLLPDLNATIASAKPNGPPLNVYEIFGSPVGARQKLYPDRSLQTKTFKSTYGRSVHVFRHVRTNQIIYSLTCHLEPRNAMPQLTFYGRKTVPPKIRKDHWRPMATVHFVDPELGQLAHRKLREFKFLRDYSWKDLPGSELAEKQTRQDWLMDQKARSVADLAATIEMVNGLVLLRHDRVCMRERSAREGPWKKVVAAAARAGVEAPRIMRVLVQLREKEKQEVDPTKKKALAATMMMLRIRRNFVLRSEVAVQAFEHQVDEIMSSKTQAELRDDAKFLPEEQIQPAVSLEERAQKIASDIQRAKDHRVAIKTAKEARAAAAREAKKGKPTAKTDPKADHTEQLHALSRSSKEAALPSHPFASLSEQASGGPITTPKPILLSRRWQLLTARAVAYAVDVEPQPLEEDDLKRDYAVQVFWDNLVDRKHANYWPENTEHRWMGPRVKRWQYVASSPEEMLKTVRRWRGDVEVLGANEGMDDHVRFVGKQPEREDARAEEREEEQPVAESRPSLMSGFMGRLRPQVKTA